MVSLGHSNGVFSLLLSLLTSDEVLRAERNKLDARLAIWKQKATEEDQRDLDDKTLFCLILK